MTHEVAPWEIWRVDFDPQVGREQAGWRPAIIVGTAFACQLPNDLVFVVPCTTVDRGLPFHPKVSAFRRPTFAMCDQLKSINRQRLARRQPIELEPTEIDTIRFVLRQLIDTR